MRVRIVMLACGLLAFPVLQGCAPAVVVGGAAAGAVVIGDPRSAETIAQDQRIEFQAYDTIYSDKELGSKVHINVTSYNRIVLLTGEADSEEMRDAAAEKLRKIALIREIHNEVAIDEPSNLQSRTTDAWITSKVKGGLLRSRDLHNGYVKVVTERGNVYLMGIVRQAQGEAAAEAVSRIDGVDRVVKVFEYSDAPRKPATVAPVAEESAPPAETAAPAPDENDAQNDAPRTFSVQPLQSEILPASEGSSGEAVAEPDPSTEPAATP